MFRRRNMKDLTWLVLGALGLPLLSLAQFSPPSGKPLASILMIEPIPQNSASLSGYVIEPHSGRPIDGASVLIDMHQPPLTAKTGADGYFRIEGIAAGEYSVSASKSGFVRIGMVSGIAVTLHAGENKTGAILRLQGTGTLSGRILDSNGRPVVQARVGPFNLAYNDSQREPSGLGFGRETETNGDGEYRLSNIPPGKYFVVCVNMPGSCYGSSGPLELNPETAEPWYHDFPFFTPRDMVRAFQPLRTQLGISRIHVGIGGSMGGQQLLEWAIEEPQLFEHIIPIATNSQHSPWGIAFNASQRLCIEADSSWQNRNPEAGIEGMKVARGVALISYRHYETYQRSQTETNNKKISDFKSESYQRYQGDKLAKRFNAFSYYKLSQGMDSHNVARGRGSAEQALRQIKANTLCIGIETDILFPIVEQQFIATYVPGARFEMIRSPFGHDGFLLEFEQIEKLISKFLEDTKVNQAENPDQLDAGSSVNKLSSKHGRS